MEGLADVRSWRLIRWCSALEGAVRRLAPLLDVLWGWLTMHHLTPNAFLQALWSAARHVIPQPRPIDHVLHDHRTRSHPLTAEDIADLQALLSDTPARHRQERPDQVLRETSITSATRSALHRGVELPTATARLAEVTEQASATTRHRGHTMDIDFLTSAYDPQKWTPFLDHIQHVPSNLLGDMLFHGVDPRDPRARGLYSVRSAAGSPLRDDRVWTSVTMAGSLLAGLDQCPQDLLHHLSHGGVQGVQHHLQFVDSGCDSLSLDSVMMGIDKNKPNPHPLESNRLVTLTSALTRTESRSVRDMLVSSLQISGHLTPDAFAYRAAFLALDFRAAVSSSLDQHRTVTMTDWDSADAFLRQQREDCTPLHRLLCLPLDFGPWAPKYYGRLRIHPLTDDSFAPPYSTERSGIRGTTPLGTLTKLVDWL